MVYASSLLYQLYLLLAAIIAKLIGTHRALQVAKKWRNVTKLGWSGSMVAISSNYVTSHFDKNLPAIPAEENAIFRWFMQAHYSTGGIYCSPP